MSTGVRFMSSGAFPATCTASVWTTAPHSLAISAISRIGNTVPVSLFAHMAETSARFAPFSSARRRSRSICPTPSTGSSTTSWP